MEREELIKLIMKIKVDDLSLVQNLGFKRYGTWFWLHDKLKELNYKDLNNLYKTINGKEK